MKKLIILFAILGYLSLLRYSLNTGDRVCMMLIPSLLGVMVWRNIEIEEESE